MLQKCYLEEADLGMAQTARSTTFEDFHRCTQQPHRRVNVYVDRCGLPLSLSSRGRKPPWQNRFDGICQHRSTCRIQPSAFKVRLSGWPRIETWARGCALFTPDPFRTLNKILRQMISGRTIKLVDMRAGTPRMMWRCARYHTLKAGNCDHRGVLDVAQS